MYTETNYFADDGTMFESADKAMEYERPWKAANCLLQNGHSLLEAVRVLMPGQKWSITDEECLSAITIDTEIYWRRYGSSNIVRKVKSIRLDGKVALAGVDKNSGRCLSIRELITHLRQFNR